MQSAGSRCLEYKNATYCASLLSNTPFSPKRTKSRTSILRQAIAILLLPMCRLRLPQHSRLGGEGSIERRLRNLRSLRASRPAAFTSTKLVASTSGKVPARHLTHEAHKCSVPVRHVSWWILRCRRRKDPRMPLPPPLRLPP
ncbi:unnamed protein product [Ixodes pacificus]